MEEARLRGAMVVTCPAFLCCQPVIMVKIVKDGHLVQVNSLLLETVGDHT